MTCLENTSLQTVENPSSSQLCVDACHVPEGSACLSGQWHRQQDRHSGPCYCPLLEVWCFLTRKGLKSHQEGHCSSARAPGTGPGSEQPRGDTGHSHGWGTGGLSAFSCTGTVVPSERQPHTRVEVMVTLWSLFEFPSPNTKGGEGPEPFSCPSYTSTAQGDPSGEASPAGGG